MHKNDFPLLLQNPDLVYLDSAATSQKPQCVINSLVDFYTRQNANPHRGLYDLAEEATAIYDSCREKVAAFIGAPDPRCVAFTSGVTMGINTVAYAWARENLKDGDMIVSTIMEHHANIVPWHHLIDSFGVDLELIGINDRGILDLEALEQVLANKQVKLVCVAHVSNVLGTLNPVKEIACLAHKYGAAILVDGAQAAGHIPIDVADLDVDFYSFSGHKMLGPMGIGALYVAPCRHSELGIMFGGGDMIARVTPEWSKFKKMPSRLEAGTQSVADAVGLSAAIDYLDFIGGVSLVNSYIHELGEYAWNKLSEISGLRLLGPGPGHHWSGSLVSFAGIMSDEEMSMILGKRGICVRSGTFCAQPLVQSRLKLHGAVRASFQLYNTKEDIDVLANCLIDMNMNMKNNRNYGNNG